MTTDLRTGEHAAARRAALADVVAAGEKDRRRLANDIHDDSIQTITAARMRLQLLRERLSDPEQLALLDELGDTIDLTIERLRHLLFELRPPALDRDGLSRALELSLEGSESGIDYALDYRVDVQPAPDAGLTLYRIVQEALTNVRKHAGATTAAVTIEEGRGGYLLTVVDDGVGFAAGGTAAAPGHVGLVAARERAELAGGTLDVESAPGEGTVLRCWVPPAPEPGEP